MSQNTNQILTRELGKIAGVTAERTSQLIGKVSRKYAGIPALNKAAAHLGAAAASRFLPNNEHQITRRIAMDPGKFMESAFAVLSAEGRIIEDAGQGIDQPVLGAVVGSGAMGMNPAVVLVAIEEIDGESIVVSIKGVAKEGLIKQYGGEKAAKRVAEKLF